MRDEAKAEKELAAAEAEEKRLRSMREKAEGAIEKAENILDKAEKRAEALQKKADATDDPQEKLDILKEQLKVKKAMLTVIRQRDKVQGTASSLKSQLVQAERQTALAKRKLEYASKATGIASQQQPSNPNQAVQNAGIASLQTPAGQVQTSQRIQSPSVSPPTAEPALQPSKVMDTNLRSPSVSQPLASAQSGSQTRVQTQPNQGPSPAPQPVLGIAARAPTTAVSPTLAQVREALGPAYSDMEQDEIVKIANHAQYARLAAAAKPDRGAISEPEGWRVIDSKHDAWGLDATVFKGPGNKVALVFHGTKWTEKTPELKGFGPLEDVRLPIPSNDAFTNVARGINVFAQKSLPFSDHLTPGGVVVPTVPVGLNKQYGSALKFAQEVKAKHPGVVFVGHSLGGALAHHTAGTLGGTAITFDAKPMPAGSPAPTETFNFRGSEDPLTAIGRGSWVVGGNLIDIPNVDGHSIESLASEMTTVEEVALPNLSGR